MQQIYSIGEVAKLLGVPAYKIEYAHTSNALAEPQCRFLGKRVYTDDDGRRVAGHFGFTLGETPQAANSGNDSQ